MHRRDFLRIATALAASASFPPSAGAEDEVRSLARRVVGPTDSDYDLARRLYDPALNPHPLAVVYCESASDVQRAIRWARRRGTSCAVRSGGHNQAGYSSSEGLVLDLSSMRHCTIDRKAMTAEVGPGWQVGALTERLAADGLGIPVGTCPSVGISGLALGGGFGMTSRRHGLTCDRLLAMMLVTADGTVLVANESEHPDLYWACRAPGAVNSALSPP